MKKPPGGGLVSLCGRFLVLAFLLPADGLEPIRDSSSPLGTGGFGDHPRLAIELITVALLVFRLAVGGAHFTVLHKTIIGAFCAFVIGFSSPDSEIRIGAAPLGTLLSRNDHLSTIPLT